MFASPSPFYNNGYSVRELQALVAPKPPQGVLVRGHAGLVINTLSLTDLDPAVEGGDVDGLVRLVEHLDLLVGRQISGRNDCGNYWPLFDLSS